MNDNISAGLTPQQLFENRSLQRGMLSWLAGFFNGS
jgi:hypothetical protein